MLAVKPCKIHLHRQNDRVKRATAPRDGLMELSRLHRQAASGRWRRAGWRVGEHTHTHAHTPQREEGAQSILAAGRQAGGPSLAS